MILPEHGRFDYIPLPQRPDYSWPGGKRLAMYIALNIETFGYGMEFGPVLGGAMPKPDHRNWSWREYGTRVGVWRLFDLFDELGLPATHLVNSYLYETHPAIFEPIRRRGDELIGHGRTNSERPGAFDEDGERILIAEATAAIAKHEGRAPGGWMPPLMSQSPVTLDLLKEAGYRFVLDWPCDDQPYWMRTRAGRLLCVPYPLETNDIVPILQLHQDPLQFVATCVRQFEEMVEQSERAPLVFAISLHTMIFGQPHRLRALREGLRAIRAHPLFGRVWLTRPGAIAAHCEALPPGIVPGS